MNDFGALYQAIKENVEMENNEDELGRTGWVLNYSWMKWKFGIRNGRQTYWLPFDCHKIVWIGPFQFYKVTYKNEWKHRKDIWG